MITVAEKLLFTTALISIAIVSIISCDAIKVNGREMFHISWCMHIISQWTQEAGRRLMAIKSRENRKLLMWLLSPMIIEDYYRPRLSGSLILQNANNRIVVQKLSKLLCKDQNTNHDSCCEPWQLIMNLIGEQFNYDGAAVITSHLFPSCKMFAFIKLKLNSTVN